jgi:hypothetical protein
MKMKNSFAILSFLENKTEKFVGQKENFSEWSHMAQPYVWSALYILYCIYQNLILKTHKLIYKSQEKTSLIMMYYTIQITN